jgi:hypothetical protein
VKRVQRLLLALATSGICTAAAFVGGPPRTAAQDLTASRHDVDGRGAAAGRPPSLESLSTGLAGGDARSREAAHAAFADLDESSLGEVEARIRSLSGRRPATDSMTAALAEIRRATGSRRADDRVDIALGVLPALAVRRDASMVASCESLLLWRALERIATPRALALIADIIALDGEAWENESRRTLERIGARLGPTLIELRSHADASVRRWSRWGTAQLGFDQPGRAIQLPAVANDTALLADTLRAWGNVHQLDAIRVVVSFVGHEHTEIRSAARAALEKFGRNAIWVVREQLELVSGQEADPRWGWERTHRALLEAHDEARLAPVRADVARGEAAEARGDLEAMATEFDRVLLRAPELAQRADMASGYARLGALRRARNDLPGAARALRRATAIASPGPLRDRWTADLRDVQADIDLRRGIADVHAYEDRAARSDHDAFAVSVLSSLNGRKQTESRQRKRLAAAIAAALCAIAAGTFLRRHPESSTRSQTRSAEEQSQDHGDTSPGSIRAVV